jgi:hypothetical protein
MLLEGKLATRPDSTVLGSWKVYMVFKGSSPSAILGSIVAGCCVRPLSKDLNNELYEYSSHALDPPIGFAGLLGVIITLRLIILCANEIVTDIGSYYAVSLCYVSRLLPLTLSHPALEM